MRILACQIQIPTMNSRLQQLDYLQHLINKLDGLLSDHNVDLILLPELATMEYSTLNFQQIDTFAEPLHGESYKLFAELCKKHSTAICYGLPRQEDGDTYISQVVIGRNGEYLTHYDKIHTAEYGDSSELKYFKRGEHLSVFELDGLKAGIIICYDMRFPELSRRLSREFEVDMILHPVAFAQDCSFHSWKQFVVSRALENQVYFISLNRGGDHFGHSIICPPWIDDSIQPTVLGEAEAFHVIEIDPQHTAQIRQDIPFRKDALECYQVLPVRHSNTPE